MNNHYIIAKKFAEEYFFEDVEKLPYEWKGYDVYYAMCVKDKELNKRMVAGCADFILVNDNEVRWTDGDEADEYDYYCYILEHPEEE